MMYMVFGNALKIVIVQNKCQGGSYLLGINVRTLHAPICHQFKLAWKVVTNNVQALAISTFGSSGHKELLWIRGNDWC